MRFFDQTVILEGQNAYKAKRYDEALERFTRVLTSPQDLKTDLIYVLELRSATHFKKENCDLALTDGKSMIRIDRRDARGYLRCGAIEMFVGKPASAVKYFEHGLKNVPPTASSQSQIAIKLAKAKEALRQRILQDKAIDPVNILPLELLQMVLSNLSYRQIVGVLRVSKSWHQRLGSMAPLNHSVDFRSPSRKKIGAKAVIAALNRLSRRRKILAPAHLDDSARKSLEKNLQNWVRWTSLQHLNLSDTSISLDHIRLEKLDLRSIEIGNHIRYDKDQIKSILESCPLLESATFANIHGVLLHAPIRPTLRRLKFEAVSGSQPDHTWISAKIFSSSCVNLETLHISQATILGLLDLSTLMRLRDLQLSLHSTAQSGVILPPSIERMASLGSYVTFHSTQQGKDEILVPLTELRDIRHTTNGAKTLVESMRHFYMGKDQLASIKLHVENEGFQDFEMCREFLEAAKDFLQGVEALGLRSSTLCDSDIDLFVACFPAVQQLKLQEAAITGAFIADLLKRPSNKINKIVLENCYKVSNDTIPWVRAKGIEISMIRDLGGKSHSSRIVTYE